MNQSSYHIGSRWADPECVALASKYEMLAPRKAGLMSSERLLQTPLHAWHQSHGGRMVEFGGWSMPVQYSTVVDEHNTVRNQVGLFDISHMGRLWFSGPDALDWLESSTTNTVAKLAIGQIQYSLMVNDSGGVIDDILVYRLDNALMVVCNASNRVRVVQEFRSLKQNRNAELDDRTTSTAMIAVQGPKSPQLVEAVFKPAASASSLKYYHVCQGEAASFPCILSRTGYTGEDGFELIVSSEAAESLWSQLSKEGESMGVKPCGLGARDTLRLEAGMPLYGHEMDESVDPYSAGLGWAVKLQKGAFRGKDALSGLKKNPKKARVGLVLESKRIARQGSKLFVKDQEIGEVTSGTFSPTLEKTIAMALLDPSSSAVGTQVSVDVRGRLEQAAVVPLPFYRRADPS